MSTSFIKLEYYETKFVLNLFLQNLLLNKNYSYLYTLN